MSSSLLVALAIASKPLLVFESLIIPLSFFELSVTKFTSVSRLLLQLLADSSFHFAYICEAADVFKIDSNKAICLHIDIFVKVKSLLFFC